NPGDAYDLALVIDRRGRRAGIAGQGRQLLYLTVLPSPHHRSELENLPWRNAGWVMHRILCPANDLAAIVDAGGIAVESTERWQRGHGAVRPFESLTGVAGSWHTQEKRRAGETLSQGIDFGGLREAHNDPVLILDRPGDPAVAAGTTERAKIDLRS